MSRRIMIGEVCKLVCLNFGLTREDLMARSQTPSRARPRMIAMVMAREFTEHSLSRIGNFFDGRDHTTVIHARDTVYSRAEADPEFAAELGRLRRVLTAHAAQIAGDA